MSRHLIDDVAVGWDELGTDLLDKAPREVVTALTGGEQWPSRTLDDLITPDGSPPVRMTVTADTVESADVQWGYILHEQGVEVISLLNADIGPIVGWATDARTAFNDHPAAWNPLAPAPVLGPARRTPPRTAPATQPARADRPSTSRR
ncbi:hypothetical protein ACWEIK_22325 [Streptomyces sp. NPDC004673]